MAKILIIDDSETLRIQLREVLVENKHSVVEGRNGIEGLEILSGDPNFDLIIVDQNMPHMDGITFCQQVQLNFSSLNIALVILTTETSIELKNKSKSFGVSGWITKPFEKDNLIAGINYLLANKKTALVKKAN